MRLFVSGDALNRYDGRGGPCLEVEDVLFDISHPEREPRDSTLLPHAFQDMTLGYTERLLAPELDPQKSTINDRLFRWRMPEGAVLNQHDTVLEKLRADPDGRGTVITFWDPAIDLGSERAVSPLIVYLRLRSGKLHATVVARSLDAMTGAIQLIVGFANLQEDYARRLALPVGRLRLLALSYHLYEFDLPRVLRFQEEKR